MVSYGLSHPRPPVDSGAAARAAQAALASGDEERALPEVEAAARRVGEDARLWQWTGLLQRALDRRDEAIPSFARAAALAPADALIAHGRARVALEAGLPAVELFEAAIRLAPGDGDALLGLVAARFAQGDADDALALLADVVDRSPGWTAGQQDLARLRWMCGDRAGFTRSIEAALRGRPYDAELWRTLLVLLGHADRRADVLAAVAAARRAIGEAPMLSVNEAIARSELGEVAAADACFARLGEPESVEIAVHLARHQLRNGRIELAAQTVERWIGAPGGAAIWPYASAAWRLGGDPRWRWLEGDERLVRVVDLTDDPVRLAGLAATLRGLHLARDQHLDQSVRGGTQTDGALFARIEPEIRALRADVERAVAAHIAALPPPDPRHPTLAPRRDRRPRFSGSWSVRLKGGGRHANHVHPAGWLSSAFYVALPERGPDDGPHAGWLTLGEPQAELGLNLPPTRLVEPKPGRLVLFPSTMWHGTRPFGRGERLTVAFDVAHPL